MKVLYFGTGLNFGCCEHPDHQPSRPIRGFHSPLTPPFTAHLPGINVCVCMYCMCVDVLCSASKACACLFWSRFVCFYFEANWWNWWLHVALWSNLTFTYMVRLPRRLHSAQHLPTHTHHTLNNTQSQIHKSHTMFKLASKQIRWFYKQYQWN